MCCSAIQITILNVALNTGELEFILLKSQIPEVTHAGFSIFSILYAIVPNSAGFCAFALNGLQKLLLMH
jgi:hypothetical protein